MINKLLAALMLFGLATLATAAPSDCTRNPRASCDDAVVLLAGTVSSGGDASALGIAGAEVTIYQAQGGSTRALAAVKSDGSGNFSIELPVNSNEGIRYAVARKGKSVELATVIGITTPSTITINEMTTVAAAYAMAQFFRSGKIVGNSLPLQVAAGMSANLVAAETGAPSALIQAPPNADQTNTWRSLGTLSNIIAACVQDAGLACASLFSLTASAKGAKPTTTLEAMLNIARNPTRNVNDIFALGESLKAFEPYLLPQHGPNSPDELLRLDGFTLAVKVNATGRLESSGDEECPFGGPGNIAFDQNGYAWITNNVIQGTPNSVDCMVVLKPNGQPADGAGGTTTSPIFGGGIWGQGYGIGIDPAGSVWAGNFGWGQCQGCVQTIGTVSKFSPSGVPISPEAGFVDSANPLYKVQGTISDQQGNIWMASYGNDSVHVFPKGNPNAGYPAYTVSHSSPFHIQIDDDGFGWVTFEGLSMLSKLALTKNGLVSQFTVALGTHTRPKGMALDSKGNAWVAAGAANAVYAVDKNGKLLGAFSGGGILGPWGVGVDSEDNVWVANFGPDQQITTKYRVSRLCGARVNYCPPGAKLGDPISSGGYTLPSGGDPVLLHNGHPIYEPYYLFPSYKPLMRATAAHIDMAGNVWITNNWKPSGLNDVEANPGGDGIIIFVGLAAPVKPTFTGQPKAP